MRESKFNPLGSVKVQNRNAQGVHVATSIVDGAVPKCFSDITGNLNGTAFNDDATDAVKWRFRIEMTHSRTEAARIILGEIRTIGACGCRGQAARIADALEMLGLSE